MRVLGLGLLFIVIVAVFALWALQEKILFAPEALDPSYQFEAGRIPFEERTLVIDDFRIHSLFFRPEGARRLILYFHGNAGNLASWSHVGAEIAEKTRSAVWIMDYPGFGKSEGQIISEDQLHGMALAFLVRAQSEAKASRLKLFLYGRSLGSGLAVKLAASEGKKLSGLILESPFYSLERVVREKAPWAPSWLLKYKLPSFSYLPSVVAPTLILHGDHDELIDVQHARDLRQLSPKRIDLKVIEGGGHNNLPTKPAYWQALAQYFRQN